jgi:hypothetical protein
VTELIASGPLRYLGGSIETFALPMGTFIVIALILFYIYRRPHDVPRLKYLRPAHQVALGTREPGTEGLVYIASATAASATAAPEAEAETGAAAETTQADAGTAAEATAEAPAETGAAAEAHVSSAAPEAESEVTVDAEHDGTTAEGETF